MPSPYLTYALAALSLGLAVAFVRVSDENSDLIQGKIAAQMKLESAAGEVKACRDKYASEAKARQFAEAAQTLAETSERAIRAELAHETKARQAAEKNLEQSENTRHVAEAALSEAQEQVRLLSAKLMEANAAKEQAERKPDPAISDKGEAGSADRKDAAPRGGEASPAAAVSASAIAAEASAAGGRSWFSFFGLF